VKYGLSVANFGSFAEPRNFVDAARAAEEAGWEGVFVWDHLAFVWGPPSADVWVLLTAAACATERVLLGPLITPVARRRPQVLANTVATLDRLSGGRVVFGAALGGGHGEFSRFGEEEDARARAEKLDEALELLRRWWDGERVTHHGPSFVVEDVALAPTPLQDHLPIWIGGNAPRAVRRAARFDGWAANTSGPEGMTMSPDDLAEKLGSIDRGDAFDVIVHGYSEPGDRTRPESYERAGATWWLETLHDMRGSYDELLARVRSGP
jgi:alkanesulfonate monooxygenase SsuD/methylene tetrahydromethanopterin reductase-like flavin-dependent oxidoreductase (luciferase family)